jgi:hypothetical protein
VDVDVHGLRQDLVEHVVGLADVALDQRQHRGGRLLVAGGDVAGVGFLVAEDVAASARHLVLRHGTTMAWMPGLGLRHVEGVRHG